MRRLAALLAVVAAIALPAVASDWLEDVVTGQSTDVSTPVAFADDVGTLFSASEVTVCNLDSADELFVSLRSTTATTSDRQVPFGACLTFSYPNADITRGGGISGVGLVSSAGETTDFQVWAVRGR